MKQLYFFLITAVILLCLSQRAFAQRDVASFLNDNTFEKIIAFYGQPLDQEEYDGEDDERHLALLYQGFRATVGLSSGNLDHIYIWTSDLCVLSSVVPGGIKVGDSVEKYKDVDFSKEVTGKHYESCGFIPMVQTYSSYSSENIFYNYIILSRGRPYILEFATENGIIKEIQLGFPIDPAPDSYYENKAETEAETEVLFDSQEEAENP